MNNSFQMQNVLSKINTYISESRETTEIELLLEQEFFYSFKYLNELFIAHYKTTINNYIKRKKLIAAYNNWVSSGCSPISNNRTVKDISSFKLKFQRSFGFTPEEAKENNIDLHVYLPESDLFNRLNKAPYIDSFEIINDQLKMNIDSTQLLKIALGFTTYLLPADVWKTINQSEIGELDKRIVLLIYYIFFDTPVEKIELRLEQLCSETEFLRNYNINSPIEINGILLFSFVLKEELFEVFKNNINELLPGLAPCSYHPRLLSDCCLNMFYSWKTSKIRPHIEDYAEFCDMDTDKATLMLWKMAKVGLIRYHHPIISNHKSN